MATVVTAADFRLALPVFADPIEYTDGQINFYLVIAQSRASLRLFGDLWSYVVYLITAHYLILAKKNQIASENGGVGGGLGSVTGIDTSQTAHDVSYTADTKAITDGTPGFWAQTSYGVEYYELVKVWGKGGIQITGFPATGVDYGDPLYGGSWYGGYGAVC